VRPADDGVGDAPEQQPFDAGLTRRADDVSNPASSAYSTIVLAG
jgi:hypothetical protein